MKTIRFFSAIERNEPKCTSGPCVRGSRTCPTPQACQLPELTLGAALRELLLFVAGVAALALGIVYLPH